MVQAKAKRRGSSVRKFLVGVRRGYLPWLTQSICRWRPDAVSSAVSVVREVRISRQRLRRPERQVPRLESLENRIMLSNVSWIAPAGGDWSVGSNWSTGTVPGTGDTAIIASLNPGAQVTYSTGSSTVAAVQASSPLEITGGTLTVTGSAAITGTIFTLDGGTLTSATLSTASGGTIQTAVGSTTTLDAATLGANTTLTIATGSTLDIADNLTLGSGAALNVDAGGTLNFIDGTSNTQTISIVGGSGSATINLDAASGSYAAGQINAAGANAGSSVTFNNGVNISGPGLVYMDTGNSAMFGDVVTGATLSASGGEPYAQLGAGEFHGAVFDTVTVASNVYLAGYGTLDIQDGLKLQNGAAIEDDANSNLVFTNGASSTQTISGSGTILLPGTASGLTGAISFAGVGSTVTIASGVTISGSGSVNAGDGDTLVLEGTVVSASLTATGGGAIQTAGGSTTTLDGVTLNSNLAVVPGSTLDIADGLALASGATVTVDAGGMLNFVDGTSNIQTVSGSGSIVLDAASGSYAAGQINANGTNAGSLVTFAMGTLISGPGDVSAAAGNTLYFAGTVQDATLSVSAGGYLQAGEDSTQNVLFNDVTVAGDMTLGAGKAVWVENGLTLANNATIYANGGYSGFIFKNGTSNAQTLGGTGIIELAGANPAAPNGIGYWVPSSTLTIGTGITLAGVGYIAGDSSTTFINYGTIIASGATTEYQQSVVQANLENYGVLEASPGNLLVIGEYNFVNEVGGVVKVDGGGIADLNFGSSAWDGNWSNAGTITVASGGTLKLGGNFTTAGIGTINSSGTVDFSGKLNNAGNILSAGTLNTWIMNGGTITGGTIGSSGTTVNLTGSSVTFDGSILDSNVTVSAGTTLNIADSLALANGATITVDAGGTLNFIDGTNNIQTVSGSGTITLDAASGSYAAGQINASGANAGSQVTFANGVNINGPGSVNVNSGNTLALADTVTGASITASAGAGIQLYAMTLQNGVMNINPNATLALENDNQYLIGSSLNNSGVVNVISGLWVYFEDGASITNAAGGVFTITNDDWFQPGVYNDPSSMTFNNAGILNINTPAQYLRAEFLPAGNANVVFNNTGTVNVTAGTLQLGDLGGNAGQTGASWSNSGTITVDSGGLLELGGNFTTAGIGTINNSGTVDFGGKLNNAGNILSAGTLNTWTMNGGTITGGTIGSSGTTVNLTGSSVTFDGSILDSNVTVSAGTTLNIADSLTLANGATLTVDAGGTLNFVDGTSNIQPVSGSGTIILDAASGSLAAGELNVNGVNTGSQVTFDSGVNITGLGTSTAPNTITAAGGNTIVFDNGVTQVTISAASGGVLQADGANFLGVTLTGTLDVNSGTGYLNAVTVAADITVTSGATLWIENGLALQNDASVTAQSGGVLRLPYTEAVNGTGQIVLAAGSYTYHSYGTLTFGSGITLAGAGQMLSFNNALLVNQGTLDANVSGQTLAIALSLQNDGTIATANGGNLAITGSSVNLETGGSLTVNAGSTVTLGSGTYSWSNAGMITVASGGTLNLGGNFTTAGIGTINSSGTINFSGKLNNAASTLSAGTLNTWTINGGTITGGTIGSSGTTVNLTGSSVTFDGSILDSNVTVSAGATLNIADGLTLANGANITVDAGGTLNFIDGLSNAQTVSGSGTITLAAASGSLAAAQINANGVNANSQVTFASGVTISGDGTSAIPNTITAAANNTIIFDNSVTNTTLSAASGGALQASGTSSNPTTFSGVTLNSSFALSANATLVVENGLTEAPGVTITQPTGSQIDMEVGSTGAQSALQPLNGDGTVTAEISGFTSGASTATAGGVTFIDSTTTGAAMASLMVSNGGNITFKWISADGETAQSTTISGVGVPVWLKLVRLGENVSAYYSTNGTSWFGIGATQSVAFSNATILAGLAMADPSGVSTDGTLIGAQSLTAPTTPLQVTGVNLFAIPAQATGYRTVTTFTDANPYGKYSDFTASINWGDGNTSSGIISSNNQGQFVVIGNHTYASSGLFNATVNITDASGISATANLTADATTVTASGQTFSPAQGQAYSGTVATFTDSASGTTASDYSASIDWGDGTSVTAGVITSNSSGGFTVTGSHTYGAAGAFYPQVTITQTSGATTTASGEADVAGLAISGQTINTVPGQLFSGNVGSFTDTASDAASQTYTASINWGDGSITTGVITSDGSGGFNVSGSHTYAAPANYTPVLTITASDGRTASASDTANVSSITATGQTISIVQDQNYTGTVATFTDSITGTTASAYSASIDWGDGTSATSGVVTSNGNGGFIVTGGHAYNIGGTFTPMITITQAGGATADASGQANVAGLTVTGSTISAFQGQSVAGDFAHFNDNAPDAPGQTYTANIAWGDDTISVGELITDGQGGFYVYGVHTYASAGNYNATVTIVAGDGRTATTEAPANVTSLTVTGDVISAVQNQSFSGAVATFTDANAGTAADQYAASINWGDGNSSIGTITSDGTGGFTVSGANTFTVAGILNPTVTITDLSGAITTATATANIAGIIVTPLNISATAGQNFSGVVGTFTDSAPDAGSQTYTATIDWGDGNTASGVIASNGTGGYIVSGDSTYMSSGTFNPTVIITAGDGRTSSADGEADVVPTPVVNIYGDTTVEQGTLYALSLQSYEYGSNSITSWSINWGDGTPTDLDIQVVSGNPGSVTHVFESNAGNVTVTATASDSGGTYSASPLTVQITDTLIPVSGWIFDPAAGQQFSGVVGDFTDTATDAATQQYTATITWGNGNMSAGTILPDGSGGFTVSGSNTYSATGNYAATITLTASDGRISVMPATADVVNTLSSLSISGSATVTEGAAYTLNLSSAGYSGTINSWTINWGDGTLPQVVAGNPASVSHVFANDVVNPTIMANIASQSGISEAANTLSVAVVPIAPSALELTAVSGSQINLSWINNSNIQTGLIIQRSTDGVHWAQIASLAGQPTSYSDTGLTEVTNYYYRILAIDAAGDSGPSNSASATTGINAPTGLTATFVSRTQINLSWTNNSASASSNYIYESTDGNNWTELGTVAATTASYTATGPFNPLTTYYFEARAYNNAIYSLASNIAATSTSAYPMVPANLTATAVSSSQINLIWTPVSGASGYVIERSASYSGPYTQIGTTTGGSTNTYSDTGLSENTLYYYEIYATNSVGNSGVSSVVSQYTQPKAPSGLTATFISPTQINLSWTDNSASATYNYIYQSTDGANWTYVDSVAATAATYAATGPFAPSNTYYFHVEAYAYGGGYSSPTTTASVTTTAYPAIPTGLTATAVSSSQMNLIWTPVSGATGYVIERSASSSGPYTQIGTTTGGSTNTYSDTGLSENTLYYYEIYATNSVGNSGVSSVVSQYTQPKAPTGLTATFISPTQINLSWTNNSASATYSYIFWSTDGSNWTNLGSVSATADTYSAAGPFNPSTTYYFKVEAGGSGGYSSPTATASVTTAAYAATPTGLTATAVSSSQINLIWTPVSGATGYVIERSTSSSGPYTQIGTTTGGSTNTYSDTGLSENTLYYYEIYAANSVGNSGVSSVVSQYTQPKAPTGLTATFISPTQINLSWTNNSASATYNYIYQSTDGANWTYVDSVAATAATYAATGPFAPSTTYYFHVEAYAYGGGGYSSPTTTASVTTTAYPAIPTGLTATAVSGSQVNLTWTPVSGATGYVVESSASYSGPYTQIGTTTGGSTNTYSDTGLSENTQYYYEVYATNSVGNSAVSSAASQYTLPNAPTGLTATFVSPTQINLSWTDNSSDASYYVYQSTDGVNWTSSDYAGSNGTTTYTATGPFNPSTTYYFEVKGEYDTSSQASNVAAVTTAAYAGTPADLTATAVSSSQINLTWTPVSGATGYVVERSASSSGPYTQIGTTTGGSTNSYSDTGLSENTLYYYEIYATNSVGNSGVSSVVSQYTQPKAPTGLTATFISPTQINLSWTDTSASATYNYIYQSTDGANWTYVGSVSASAATYLAAGPFTPSTTDYFKVEAYAYYGGGYSSPTNTALVTTAAYAATPTALSATVVSSSQINLSWTPVSSATGYMIEQSTSQSDPYVPIATITGGSTNSYSDTGLSENTQYYYEIYATNTVGNSAPSSAVSAYTQPNAPTGLTATFISPTQINLSWTDTSASATYNYIYQSTDDANWTYVGSVAATAATYTAAGPFNPSTTYYFKVEAYAYGAGGYSSPTTAASVTTTAYPATPTGLTATAVSSSQINLSWAAVSGATGYVVESAASYSGPYTQIGTTNGGSTAAYSDTGLSENTLYYYEIYAVNSMGNSPESTTVSAYTQPAAPTGLTATFVSPTQINLSWTDNSASTTYNYIYQSTDGANWTQVGNVAGNAATYAATGPFTPATTYYFKVEAGGSGGYSSPPTTASVNTTAYAPMPTGLSATVVSSSQINLSWTPVSSATGYVIEQSTSQSDPYVPITTITGGSTNTYSDTGLSENTQYYYEIYATNTVGNSAPSSAVSAYTQPNAPTGLTATFVSPTQINLSWTDNSASATSNDIYQSTDDTNWTYVGSVSATAATYFAAGPFNPSTTYYFKVEASGSGGYSSPTTAASVTTTAYPATPTGLTATAVSSSQINLSWAAVSGATGYVVESSTSYSGPYTSIATITGGSTNSYSDTGLSENTLYYYEIYATNSMGNSPESTAVSAYTQLNAPTGLTATFISPTQINLSWANNSARASSNYIYQSTDDVNWTNLANVADNVISYTAAGPFNPSTTYYFEVEAAGTGGNSAPATATITTGSITIVTPAAASPVPVTGTNATLSVLGSIPGTGESGLTYTWSVVSAPAGGSASFSTNGTNAAKNSTVTFTQAGVYTFQATITEDNWTATSDVAVTVQQTLASITLSSSGNLAVLPGGTQQFAATGYDQFGIVMAAQPAFTWSISDPTMGTISSTGLFAAASASNYGPVTITASVGAITQSATLTVSPITPTHPFAAMPLDSGDIGLYWLNLPALAGGQTLEYSTDSTFSSGVATVSLSSGTTNYTAGGLSAATTYYFELLPTASSGPAVATASATTFGGNVGGSGSYTAPTITQQATYSQPDPNDVTLTMAATGQNGDPISYLWQLLSSPSNAQAPSFDPAYQTVTAQVFVAGNYVFMGTATDTANNLSVTSDVTVTVDQKLTNLQLAFGSPVVATSGTIQFGDTELDQFGNSMNDPVTWSVVSGGGTIDASGLYSAPSTTGDASVQASADGVTKTTNIAVKQEESGVYIGDNGTIYVQATDVNKVKVFTTSGALTATLPFNGPFPQGMTFRGPQNIYLADGSYLDASNASNANPYIVLKNASGTVIQTYTIPSAQADDTPFTGMALDPNGTSFWADDASCYVYEFNISTGAMQQDFLASGDLGGLGVTTAPPTPGITLGDGSSNQVLQGNGNDAQNLKPLHLFVPADLPSGTTVTLTDSQPGEVDVWNSANPGSGASPLLGTGTGSVTWSVGSQSVPSTLYVGIEHGSANVGDIQFTLAVTPPGGQAVTAKTSPATAVVLKITLGDAGQKLVNILTSSGGLNSFDLVPLNYIYEGPTQASLTISKAAAQEIEVWTTENPTTGDTPVLGGSSGHTIWNIPGNDVVNGQLWVGASVKSTIASDIQFTLKPILPAPLAPVTVQSQKATAIPGQIDIFFDGTDNNGRVDAAKGTATNVYEMYLVADQNLASRIYEPGVGTGGVAGGAIRGALLGWTCEALEQQAMQQLTNDLRQDPNADFIINIVGFSRGAAESLDFSNQVESYIQQGRNDFTGAQIGFLGLYDPVDSINAQRNNPGNLNVTVSAGIAHVADAVALSENRDLFNWINLIGSPNITVVGFLGAHSDIGGGYGNDPLSNTTLHWMMSQATAAGMVFTNLYQGLVNGFAATEIHDSYKDDLGGVPLPPIQRSLPGNLLVDTPGGYIDYGSVPANYWNPDFAGDLNYYNEYLQLFLDGEW